MVGFEWPEVNDNTRPPEGRVLAGQGVRQATVRVVWWAWSVRLHPPFESLPTGVFGRSLLRIRLDYCVRRTRVLPPLRPEREKLTKMNDYGIGDWY